MTFGAFRAHHPYPHAPPPPAQFVDRMYDASADSSGSHTPLSAMVVLMMASCGDTQIWNCGSVTVCTSTGGNPAPRSTAGVGASDVASRSWVNNRHQHT